MKVIFKNMIRGYRGKCDGLVYFYNPRLRRVMARPYVERRRTAQNDRFGEVSTRLRGLEPSPGFKRDMAIYVELYNNSAKYFRQPFSNWYNAYTKMMWELAKRGWHSPDGSPLAIDLRTITREFIAGNDLPCRSVRRAVEAGLLKRVKGWESLDSVM